LRELYKNQIVTDIAHIVWVDVDQFYGIEYDEFASRIAEVAMWLIDHQMNMQISEQFGHYFVRLPLTKSAKIVNGNALRIDWEEVVPKTELSYILGNPPFIGSKLLNKEQREDMANIFSGVKNGKILDYVTAWYLKASQYIENTNIEVAFVSTNSITQGEQVSVLWGELLSNYAIKIHFAHSTFKWNNEAKGKAAVYVVIIGFANFDIAKKKLFSYPDIKGEPDELIVKNINPYLANAKDLVINRQSKPINNVPKMAFGNMPLDGGRFLFTPEEKQEFVNEEANAEKYFLPLISAREFLNNKERWCLWLEGINPKDLRSMPKVMERVEAVKQFRLASVAPSTQKHAATPTLFRDRKNPNTYILIPSTTSENRKYIPMGFFIKNNIANNSCHIVPEGSLFHFGVLMSEMHMAWVKYTCGRLESRFRYSKDVVYNNYPWPKEILEKNKKKVEEKAQKVLDVRAEFPESSLADLYDPLTMPPKLVKAHQELDKAVDLCYRSQAFITETARIEFLFNLYNEYTAPMFNEKKKKK
jgi:hypothetical protein